MGEVETVSFPFCLKALIMKGKDKENKAKAFLIIFNNGGLIHMPKLFHWLF